MKRRLLAIVAVAAGVITPAARAHSIVLPFSSRPGDLQLYTVVVPTETDAATNEVAVKVPEGIDFLLVKDAPGWTVKVERRNDRIDVVRWSGSAPPDQYVEFGLIARNPILEGDLPWKITQTYANGETVRWIGAKGSEFPASITRISESAVPVDVATGLNGGGDTSGTATTTATGDGASTASDGSSDTLARIAGFAGLALGVLALAAVVVTRRRPVVGR